MDKEIEAYCLKCKEKVMMEGAEEAFWKNGTRVAKGKCSECGMKIYKILPKKEED